LGANRELEHLPVGRRVAFDQAKGRLWVVCRACARWNLTPLEDRWETIEACEKRFRSTQVRVSTHNVGLGRMPEGLELVRIGKPLRPEFAAWRYGEQFMRRHARSALRRAGKTIVGPGLLVLAPAMGAMVGLLPSLLLSAGALGAIYRRMRRPDLEVPTGQSAPLEFSSAQIQNALLIRDDTDPEGWALMVQRLKRLERYDWLKFHRDADPDWLVLHGHEARTVATMMLPKVNPLGGNEAAVSEAVRWLEAAGGPEGAFVTFSRSHLVRMPLDNTESRIVTLHAEVRLALEMALHEDEERKALAGELSVLTWVWQHEEMLAELADGLTVPPEVEAQLEALRGRPNPT
jgi:hypothetical protein